MDVDEHAEELASALGVDKAEVKDDLENLLSYSVPVDEAKQSIRRKHGGSGGDDATPTTKDVAGVTTEDGNVTVTIRVLSVGRRSIRYQGDEQTIREGEFADETGRISYTAWEDFGFEPGDSITVGNAGVREWDGEPELNIGQSSTVAIETTPVEVPYDVGGDTDLVELRAGDRGRNVEVEVLESEERVIDGRDGETTIRSGVVADESGRLPFTDWEARPELREGSELRFEEVYVREFRGVPQVNLGVGSISPAVSAGILGLGLRSAAYQSQIFRASLASVDDGQLEAGRAVGLSRFEAIRYVVVPQALRRSIPGFQNEFTIVLKDTSIVFAIGLAELLTRGYDLFTQETTAVLEVILFISAIYFVLTFTTNRALDYLGTRYAIPEGESA